MSHYLPTATPKKDKIFKRHENVSQIVFFGNKESKLSATDQLRININVPGIMSH